MTIFYYFTNETKIKKCASFVRECNFLGGRKEMATYAVDTPPPPYEDDSSINRTISIPFVATFGTCPCCDMLAMGSNGCLNCAYTRHKCDKCQIQMDEGIVRLKLVLCKTCA